MANRVHIHDIKPGDLIRMPDSGCMAFVSNVGGKGVDGRVRRWPWVQVQVMINGGIVEWVFGGYGNPAKKGAKFGYSWRHDEVPTVETV